MSSAARPFRLWVERYEDRLAPGDFLFSAWWGLPAAAIAPRSLLRRELLPSRSVTNPGLPDLDPLASIRTPATDTTSEEPRGTVAPASIEELFETLVADPLRDPFAFEDEAVRKRRHAQYDTVATTTPAVAPAAITVSCHGCHGCHGTEGLIAPTNAAQVLLQSAAMRVPASHMQSEQPNLVFLISDDQDVASLAFMPRLQALLGDQGITFNNFFVTESLCCPSHVSILTGQYPHNHGILNNDAPLGGWQKFHDQGGENSTFATWLQDAGYHTGRFGKYLAGYPNGSTHIPPGWDEWVAQYGAGGQYFNYSLNDNGTVVRYGNAPEDYSTDVLANRAVEFLARAEEREEQPFLLFFSPSAPHNAVGSNLATPAPRHVDAFAGTQAPRTPSFNEEDVSDKPQLIRNRPLLDEAAMEQIDLEYQSRLESLQALDEAVERIVTALADLGELDNTYVVFTSDNGFHQGQHRLPRGKDQIYEEDIRVPLLLRGPGVPQGVTREELALNIDFAPTFAELAGATPGHEVDGRSLVPLLGEQPPATWRTDFLVELYRTPAMGGEEIRALRTQTEVYVEYLNLGEREHYDLVADPYQLESLHATTPPEHLEKLSARLAELAVCADDSCRAARPVGCNLYPQVGAWHLNQDGRTGWSTDPRIHAAVSQILADVQRVAYNATDAYIQSTSVPSHAVGPFNGNPNIPSDQAFTIRIPYTPQPAADPRRTNLGPIGVFVNGVSAYNALDARSYQNLGVWNQDAYVFEGRTFDAAQGHPQMRGNYHYHSNPIGLREQLGDTGKQHSPLLGYAYDGFPIYGPYGYVNPDGSGGVQRMESGYQLRKMTERTTLPDGTKLPPELHGPVIGNQFPLGAYAEDYEFVPRKGALDEFNGRFTVTPEYPCGTFAYFVTLGVDETPAYPYLVGPRYFGEVLQDNVTRTVVIPDDVVDYWP